MRTWETGKVHLGSWALALVLFALPGLAAASHHEGMKGHGAGEDHGAMMKMGDKVYAGPMGSWNAEARLIDMKTQMEKAKAAGMKMEGAMMKTHHIALQLIDPKTGKPVEVAQGNGTVTVTGPGLPEEKTPFMVMDGHFGADINLPKPGKYTFRTEVETGGKTGAATFTHTVR